MLDDTARQQVYDQQQELIGFIEKRLTERYRHRSLESDLDFVMGAMTALQFLTLGPDADRMDTQLLPAYWMLYPLSGRSIVAHALKQQGADEKWVESVEMKESRSVYHKAKLDEMVRFVHTVYETTDRKHEGTMHMTPSQKMQWFRQIARSLLDDMMEEFE